MMLTILCCYVLSRCYHFACRQVFDGYPSRGGRCDPIASILAVRRLSSIAPALALIIALLFPTSGVSQVAFDVNAMAPARDASHYGLLSRLPNSRFVEVQLESSALFQPGSTARVTETMIRVLSRHDDVLVADFSPRTELQTDVFGPMQVSVEEDRMREMGVQGVAGYPMVGNASGFAYQSDVGHQTVHFAKKPAMEPLTAAGTLARQRGVYFKMHPSSQTTLEGTHPFRIVFEVPESWRADLLDVTIEAVGFESANSRKTAVLTSQPFVIAVFQDRDDAAARIAANYIKQQSNLAIYAKSYARMIEQRSYPTPFHKLGAKLDIYEPEIPQGWFDALVYRSGSGYHLSKLSPLPVDVRIAIMNYIDHKQRLESLSGSKDLLIDCRSNTAARPRIPSEVSDVARR